MKSLLSAAVVLLMSAISSVAFTVPTGTPDLTRSKATADSLSSYSPFSLRSTQVMLPVSTLTETRTALFMAGDSNQADSSATSSLPFFLDPGTKGGALVLMFVLFVVPIGIYQFLIHGLGYDEIDAGIRVGMGFTVGSTLLWMSTYLFRVATKDMTYAKQLKDYENAVIAKRLEELDDDEVQALVEEVEKDSF